MGEVALPALAHAHYGAAGYGALLACLAIGGMAGTLGAARTGGLRSPALFASAAFVAEAVSICLVPYLGGPSPGAGAVLPGGGRAGRGGHLVRADAAGIPHVRRPR